MTRVNIIHFPGTNCHRETVYAFEKVGADARIVLVQEIISGKVKIADCDAFCFPGGFSYGDNIDTGIVAATLIRDFIPQLLEAEMPIIGICNGFQTMVRAGMFGSGLALTRNKSGRFCSRPIQHLVEPSNCLWTRGLEGQVLTFPAAHGYGRLEVKVPVNVAMTYISSPNGGPIAGISSANGRLFGLMNHPERSENENVLQILRNGIKFA